MSSQENIGKNGFGNKNVPKNPENPEKNLEAIKKLEDERAVIMKEGVGKVVAEALRATFELAKELIDYNKSAHELSEEDKQKYTFWQLWFKKKGALIELSKEGGPLYSQLRSLTPEGVENFDKMITFPKDLTVAMSTSLFEYIQEVTAVNFIKATEGVRGDVAKAMQTEFGLFLVNCIFSAAAPMKQFREVYIKGVTSEGKELRGVSKAITAFLGTLRPVLASGFTYVPLYLGFVKHDYVSVAGILSVGTALNKFLLIPLYFISRIDLELKTILDRIDTLHGEMQALEGKEDPDSKHKLNQVTKELKSIRSRFDKAYELINSKKFLLEYLSTFVRNNLKKIDPLLVSKLEQVKEKLGEPGEKELSLVQKIMRNIY